MQKKWLSLLAGSAVLCAFFSFNEPDVAPLPDPEVVADSYPKDYFQSPVNTSIRLTGTFGELRMDHFHSGIDIKSATGGVGQSVMAAAEGFVDRIKVDAGGYGNVVYLKHPNGYTTVYAHLDRFSPELRQYVRNYQYKHERFDVDLRPQDGQFKVKKGQEIGKLGNSGGSTGPHLHFEIRNSTTGKVINPQLFNLPIADNVPPEIRDMKVYYLTDDRQVITSKALPVKSVKKGEKGLEGDTVLFSAWRVGFGVKTYDQMTGFQNDNGIYAISLFADDQLTYEWRMGELDFDETRYNNAHIDYPARKRYGAWFHRCFVLPGDLLNNYVRTATMGSVALYKDKPVKIRLKVTDASGNTTTLNFWALRDEEVAPPPVVAYQYDFNYQTENNITLDDFTLKVPQGALYESLHFQYNTSPSDDPGQYSAIHHVQDTRTPVHKYMDIALKPAGLPENLRSKAVITACGEGRPDNCGGEWSGDMLKTRVRSFGDYCIMADTEPPKIVSVVFADDMRKKSTIAFRIRDNFAVDGRAKGLRYRGTVDGNWVLFEYDRKRDRITYHFDEHVGPGKHRLKLVVKDDRDNEAFFEGTFLR